MIKITESDADKVLKYIRKLLSALEEEAEKENKDYSDLQKMGEKVKCPEGSEKEMERLESMALKLHVHKNEFFNRKREELQDCILILTAGSMGVEND